MQDIDRKMKLSQQSGEYQKNQEVKEEGRDQRLYKPINTRLQKQHLMDKEKITTKSKRGSWKTQLAIETVGRSWSMWEDRESDRAWDTNGHQGAIIDKISRDSQESESSLGTPYKLYKKCPKTLNKKNLWRLLKVVVKERNDTNMLAASRGLFYPERREVRTYYSVQNYLPTERWGENIFLRIGKNDVIMHGVK